MIFERGKLLSNLKDICANGRVSNLYIFEGERGIGKKTVSDYFANMLICEDASGCGMCQSCKTYKSLAHPDVIVVSEEEKAEMGIDHVRKLIKEVYLKPQLSKRRVFIIKNAEKLNKSAQNALLKIIEEPPSYAVFIMLCENSAMLLNTILSRGVKIKIPPLDKESLRKLIDLENDSKADFYISYCAGNVGRLMEIASDEEFLTMREEVLSGLKCLLKDRYDIYKTLEIFEKYKDRRQSVFNVAETFLRDVLFLKMGGGMHIINADKKDMLNEFNAKISSGACLEVTDIIEKTNNEIGKYGNYSLIVQSMLIRCWEAING